MEGGGYCPKHLALDRSNYDRERRDPAAKKFYNSSKAWKVARAAHIAAHPICEICNKVLAVLVHHIKALELFPELALVDENLQSACNRCHEQHHGKEKFRRHEG